MYQKRTIKFASCFQMKNSLKKLIYTVCWQNAWICSLLIQSTENGQRNADEGERRTLQQNAFFSTARCSNRPLVFRTVKNRVLDGSLSSRCKRLTADLKFEFFLRFVKIGEFRVNRPKCKQSLIEKPVGINWGSVCV